MAAYSRPALRNLFDDSPTPHIAHPPRTHHRDYYIAADGSFRQSGEGGLGVLIETRDGQTVARLAMPDRVPDNNVAEYRALHLGLDVLAEHAESDARVGVLVDHDDLAANVNRATLAAKGDRPPHPYRVPRAARHHWRGIRARVARFAELRAARINSRENPAHPLANTPEQYRGAQVRPDPADLPGEPADLRDEAGTRERGNEQVPPPSRADRHASD
jgi:ribonuclease HI